MKMIKPKPLAKGSTIGIVAPSFFIEKEKEFKVGIARLEDMGFKIKYGDHVFTKYRNTTATAEERAQDIMSMFNDPNIDGIIASDGGCTAIEVLEKLDYDLISKNPKVFSGFSDITHFNLAFLAKSNLSTLNGLDIVNGFGNDNDNDILKNNIDFFSALTSSKDIIGRIQKSDSWENWKDGKARGVLVGGWLDAIVNLTKTDMFPDFDNIILFWESIDMQPHNMNMLLNSLKISGLFNKVRGMIIGNFVDCEEKEYWDCTPSIKEIITDVVEPFDFPILANVSFGHTDKHLSLPEGILVSMDSKNKVIEFEESYCA